MMKKILATMAVAVAATVSLYAAPKAVIPPLTCDTGYGFYVAPQGGVNVFTSVGHEYGRNWFNMSGVRTSNETTDSKAGGFAGIKLGYNFKTDCLVSPALEFDGYWAQSRMTLTHNEFSKEPQGAITINDKQTWDVAAHGNTFVYMINGIARVDLGCFKPYAGLGIGFASTGFNGSTDYKEVTDIVNTATGDRISRDITKSHSNHIVTGELPSSTYFAAQVVAGLDYYVTPCMSVFTEYKFLNVCGDQGMNNLRNNIVGAGVRFHF